MEFRPGCSGFSYTSWRGNFYPKKLPESKWLQYYSQVFDYVEIDSSFYSMPDTVTTRRWGDATPDKFIFTAKFPERVTHKKRLRNVENELKFFYESMAPLADKLVCLLIQLPPSLTMEEGLKKLQELPTDKRFRYAVEARHKSWFSEEVYSYFRKNEICLAWSQLAELQTPPIVTTDFIYIRFIGDRTIAESDFGRIQKDRTNELRYWADQMKALFKDDKLKMGVAAANNHFAGYGPATANQFRKMLGLPEVAYGEKLPYKDTKVASLDDF